MVRRITQFGEPVLRQKGETVTAFDDNLKKLASDMLDTMYAADGIGLAAQQVGVTQMIFVMDLQLGERAADFSYSFDGKTPPLELIMPLVAVNPIVELQDDPYVYEEGCLSFPGIRGDVERPEQVTMNFQDLEGAPHEIKADGLFGRVIQHEYDHLQGILFIERMKPNALRPLEPRLKKLKRNTRDWLKQQRKAT